MPSTFNCLCLRRVATLYCRHQHVMVCYKKSFENVRKWNGHISYHLPIWAGIAQWYSAGVWGGRLGGWIPARAGNFSLHHPVQTGSGVYPASYPMGTRGSFPGVRRPGLEADHSPSSSAEVKECVELYLNSANTPSWHGAQLKAQGQLFLFLYIYLYLIICLQTNQPTKSFLPLLILIMKQLILAHTIKLCFSVSSAEAIC
jgi:hypothetical protein